MSVNMTNNKQQTALEIFWNQLPEILLFTVDTETAVKLQEAYKQAKEMEREQHRITAQDFYYGKYSLKNFEDYYNETYGK